MIELPVWLVAVLFVYPGLFAILCLVDENIKVWKNVLKDKKDKQEDKQT